MGDQRPVPCPGDRLEVFPPQGHARAKAGKQEPHPLSKLGGPLAIQSMNQLGARGSPNPDGQIVPGLEPPADIDAAEEGDAAIDHQELAVVASDPAEEHSTEAVVDPRATPSGPELRNRRRS